MLPPKDFKAFLKYTLTKTHRVPVKGSGKYQWSGSLYTMKWLPASPCLELSWNEASETKTRVSFNIVS